MSLLTIAEAASRLLSVPTPTTNNLTPGSGDTTVLGMRLREATIEAARDLATRHNWEVMIREKTFTTVAQAEQTSSVASDFDRYVPDTMFNRTSKRRVLGPVSTEEWQEIKATSATAANPVFRFRRPAAATTPIIIAMAPDPTAGETIAYEYVSTTIAHSSGTPVAEASIGGGTSFYFDERILILGCVVRFKKSAGMDASAEEALYEQRVRNSILRDGSRARISSDPYPQNRVPMRPYVPEGSWDI